MSTAVWATWGHCLFGQYNMRWTLLGNNFFYAFKKNILFLYKLYTLLFFFNQPPPLQQLLIFTQTQTRNVYFFLFFFLFDYYFYRLILIKYTTLQYILIYYIRRVSLPQGVVLYSDKGKHFLIINLWNSVCAYCDKNFLKKIHKFKKSHLFQT